VGITSASSATELSPSGSATPEPKAAAVCLNCATPLVGPFCSSCGQRDVPPYPSVRELAVDAFWELSGWDGRFATTVRALFRRPGMLTREFLEVRRARYISPLRLYLMASLVYFLISAAAPNVNLGRKPNENFVGAQGTALRIGTTVSKETAAERVGDAATRSMQAAKQTKDDPDPQLDSLTAEQRAAVLKDIEKAPAIMRPLIRRAVADAKGLQRSILEAMPRMLFALLPVFAAILALFYRHHKYPEHLYFAIHLHAFVFLALAFMELSKFTRAAPIVKGVGIVAVSWIPVYSTIAFRRAYGGSVIGTLAKETGIGLIYSLAGGGAFLVTLWAISVFS
jgi:Protein of unknown function (DUF3667)